MRIGLFGGSFDPPHAAHRAASLIAMKRLDLERVWWLVTPGNPLKDTRGLAPLEERIAAARALAHHPRIDVTGLEADIGARYTYDTMRYLFARCPRRALRLDHGGRQSAQLPSLAEMARHRRHGPDRGDRPSRAEPLRHRRVGRAGAGPPSPARFASRVAGGSPPAGMGLPPWPQIAFVIDRACGRHARNPPHPARPSPPDQGPKPDRA